MTEAKCWGTCNAEVYPVETLGSKVEEKGGGELVELPTSESDVVLLLFKVQAIVFWTDELIDLIRVHIVATDGFSIIIIIITINIFHGVIVVGDAAEAVVVLFALHTCFLAMEKLATLGLTDARVAKVRTLKGMALGARSTFLAVTVKAKGPTYRSTWSNLSVSILAVGVSTLVSQEMQASRHALGGHIVR